MNEQQQIDHFLNMQEMVQEIRDGQPKYEEAQWLNVFPEAKKRYGKYIKGKLKIERKYLSKETSDLERSALSEIANNTAGSWRDQLIRERFELDKKRITKRLRTINALVYLIGSIGREKINNSFTKANQRITELQIQKAKEYPIEELVEINKAGFTKCFAHNDKKPSAYCKKNFVHCFVCQKSWDTIAILVERDGHSFKEAVLKLQ